MSTPPRSAFKFNVTKGRAVARVEKSLPKTPRRKREVVSTLVKNLRMGESRRKNKPGQEKVTLDREQKEWLREQLDRPIYSTMAPGKKDNVYKGKVDGEKQYEQKRFLLWPLRDLHD